MKDTGVGIHPEIYPKLFSKFASHSDGGIGLGLYLCKNIVKAHGVLMERVQHFSLHCHCITQLEMSKNRPQT
jgi:K+-sensing histidine kinase KdpD